jgi:hypothetical protein
VASRSPINKPAKMLTTLRSNNRETRGIIGLNRSLRFLWAGQLPSKMTVSTA